MKKVTARAHTNIAFIKYWGKKDTKLFLPYNNSLSLTLEEFYTDTTIEVASKDVFFLNDQLQDEKALEKIKAYLQIFRQITNNQTPLKITSYNHVPTAAGLASSSSAYAALATALNSFYNLNFDQQTLSTYARRGSGSATRSIYGGFVEWQQGIDNKTSYATKFDEANFDIGLLICVLNDQEKTISSRKGMEHTVLTSDFYPAWVKTAKKDLEQIKSAIKEQNVEKIGTIAEHNAMKMHATTLAANPPFTYLEPNSLIIIQEIHKLRKQGLNCHFTMDAGPNVKIIAPYSQLTSIKEQLVKVLPQIKMIITKPGPDAYILKGDEQK